MIHFIKGKIATKKKDYIILERQGIGFKIYLSEKNLERLREGEEKTIYTHLAFRNDRIELYGVLSQEELYLYQIFERISGIGPKGALTLASVGSLQDFKKAIEEGNFSFFEGIKGIGKKKIQKIILEIGGELKEISKKKDQEVNKKALKALISLGFSKAEAKEALSLIPKEIKKTEDRVKEALKILSQN